MINESEAMFSMFRNSNPRRTKSQRKSGSTGRRDTHSAKKPPARQAAPIVALEREEVVRNAKPEESTRIPSDSASTDMSVQALPEVPTDEKRWEQISVTDDTADWKVKTLGDLEHVNSSIEGEDSEKGDWKPSPIAARDTLMEGFEELQREVKQIVSIIKPRVDNIHRILEKYPQLDAMAPSHLTGLDDISEVLWQLANSLRVLSLEPKGQDLKEGNIGKGKDRATSPSTASGRTRKIPRRPKPLHMGTEGLPKIAVVEVSSDAEDRDRKNNANLRPAGYTSMVTPASANSLMTPNIADSLSASILCEESPVFGEAKEMCFASGTKYDFADIRQPRIRSELSSTQSPSGNDADFLRLPLPTRSPNPAGREDLPN